MHYVLLASHTPESCPTSNATIRELMQKIGPEVPGIAERTGVKFVSGPFTNREHILVVVVEAQTGESVDRFLDESRLAHWNSVRVLPSVPLEESVKELDKHAPIF